MDANEKEKESTAAHRATENGEPTRATHVEVDAVIEGAGAIQEAAKKRPLATNLESLRLMLGLLKDVRSGAYREVPAYTVAAIVGALLYVLNPFDFTPDALPIFGVVDDAAVLAACLTMVHADLGSYAEWLRETKKDAEHAQEDAADLG